MVYLMPEFQGNYWVMLKAIRAAYDVLLHNGLIELPKLVQCFR